MIILVDTGVLIALIDPDTREHQWAQDRAKRLPQPFQTSEPVLTEAAFVLARDGFDADELFALAEAGVIRVGLRFEDERAVLRELMARYRDVPMSLADATLVRLAELNDDSSVFTLDADFRIYRRHRNKIIPVMMPGDDQTLGSRLAESPVPYRVRRRPAKGS
jgi:predicted nucleic acid-binding protein